MMMQLKDGTHIRYRVIGGIRTGSILNPIEQNFANDHFYVVMRRDRPPFESDIVHVSDIVDVICIPGGK